MTAQPAGTVQADAWAQRMLPPVELVRPGVWSIPTAFPGAPIRYVLTYAVQYGKGVALVDTGWPCEAGWTSLVDGLATAGWGLADIRAVLITHGHGDHLGLAGRIRESTDAWIALHEADLSEPTNPGWPSASHVRSAGWLARRGGRAEDFAGEAPRPDIADLPDASFRPDRLLEDGTRPLGAHTDLISVWTPGHSPGHTCFYHEPHGLMLTGDHVLPRLYPPIEPGEDEGHDYLGEYFEAMRRLTRYDVEEVLPGHEYRFTDLPHRIGELREFHDHRMNEVEAAVAAHPGATSVQIAQDLSTGRPWGRMNGLQRWFQLRTTYVHLRHLQHTKRIHNRGAGVDEWIASNLDQLLPSGG